MNPDPRTVLAETETIKLLNLRDLAEQIPDGFYSGPRVLRNPIPGSGNHLPGTTSQLAKRQVASTSRPAKVPRTAFNTKLAPDPLTLTEAKASPEWPNWNKKLETKYICLPQKTPSVWRGNH